MALLGNSFRILKVRFMNPAGKLKGMMAASDFDVSA